MNANNLHFLSRIECLKSYISECLCYETHCLRVFFFFFSLSTRCLVLEQVFCMPRIIASWNTSSYLTLHYRFHTLFSNYTKVFFLLVLSKQVLFHQSTFEWRNTQNINHVNLFFSKLKFMHWVMQRSWFMC